jgi:predicted CoA-binding protein
LDDVAGTDETVERILTTYDTITVVGASADPAKAAHGVPALMQRHGWRVIPVNLRGGTILGERAYRALAEVPGQVGLVDVFRPSRQAADVARQAVAAGATALWLQLGISSEQAREIAEAAGLLYVENRCMAVEQRRLGLDAPKAAVPWAGVAGSGGPEDGVPQDGLLRDPGTGPAGCRIG